MCPTSYTEMSFDKNQSVMGGSCLTSFPLAVQEAVFEIVQTKDL